MDSIPDLLEQLSLGFLAGVARAFSEALQSPEKRRDYFRYIARGVVGVVTGYLFGMMATSLHMPEKAAIAVGGWLGADGVEAIWKRFTSKK